MVIRLNKYLAQTGHYSRREADGLIGAGRVIVDGKPAVMGQIIKNPEKVRVTVDNKPVIVISKKLVYGMFYKPNGTITTRRDEMERRTIYDCLPPKLHHLKPVGRLDRNSSGLLLLTNDGELQYRATQAKFHLPKVYQVRIEPAIQDASALAKSLLAGVFFEEEQVQATVEEVYQISPDTLGMTLITGYNRQIRRMLEHHGYQVKQLKRIAFGPILLKGLTLGEYRPLALEEVSALKAALGLSLKESKSVGHDARTLQRNKFGESAQRPSKLVYTPRKPKFPFPPPQ
jgi:23S rRNA pseudouridine2605 synthase